MRKQQRKLFLVWCRHARHLKHSSPSFLVEVRLFAQLQLCRTFGVLVRICLSSSPSNPIDIFLTTKWYIQDRNMHANKAQHPAKKRKSGFLPWGTLKVVAKPQDSMGNGKTSHLMCAQKWSNKIEGCHWLIFLKIGRQGHTIGRVSRLRRSCHPFLRLNAHDAQISSYIYIYTCNN